MKWSERRTSAVARRYAKALLDVARQKGEEDDVAREIEPLGQVFREDALLRGTLSDPLVREGRRREVLDALIEAARPLPPVAELLRQMLEHDRMDRLPEVAVAYRQLLDEERGVVEVDVATAAALDEGQRARLRGALERLTGKQVRLNEEVDESLLGGVLARVGDTVYDASLRGRLRQIREEMVEGPA